MTHDYHEALPGFDARQIFYDGCVECEHRAESIDRALANLDSDAFQRAWRRAWDWYGFNAGGYEATGPISDAERPLLLALWGVQVHLERRGLPLGRVPGGEPTL